MKLKHALSVTLASLMLIGSAASAISGEIVDLNTNDTDPAFSDDEVCELPSKVDLRDRGVVPPVRNQNPWGTCWGFGAVAASEISILSDLGLTCEQFREKYGYDMDLSERHLAWFGTDHLPEVEEDDPNASEIEIAQAGEGIHTINDETDPDLAHFDLGGELLYCSGIFSAGFGPELEADIPYTANDGTRSRESDWSVSEETRFISAFDLLDSSIFPNPTVIEEDGTCTYNEAATNAIKQEINKGHAVSILYHADNSKPIDFLLDQQGGTEGETSAEDCSLPLRRQILRLGYTNEDADNVITYLTTKSTDGMAQDKKLITAEISVILLFDEAIADEMIQQMENGSLDPEDLLQTLAAALAKRSAESVTLYTELATCAQYTYDSEAKADHAACIVGYDDDYAVENFLPDHQPPAPGAWIVRNSWGTGWGDYGYFYLSYYDKSIAQPESFVFDVSDVDNRTDQLMVMNYAYMQIASILKISPEAEAPTACVFRIDNDEVLANASIFTAVPDTDAVLSVYCLNENAATPEDGKLLDRQTLHFDYAGYHRVKLTGNYYIHAESNISIVVSQTYTKDGEVIPVVPLNTGMSYEGKLKMKGNLTDDDYWSVARVNAGESFIVDNGQWVDWKDMIEQLKQRDEERADMVFDNPSLKLYLYPYDQLREIHDLNTTSIDENGNEISVCNEDGYTVIY